MLIRLLGTVEIAGTHGWRRAGPAKQACVLACLAMSPGTTLGMDALAHRVWGADVPPAARSVVYGHIARLRKLTGAHEAISLQRVGIAEYRLDVPMDEVDALAARTLADRARAARSNGDVAMAGRYWRDAARMWTGPALSGVTGPWADRTRRRLADEHLAAVTGCAECELELGHHETVIAELEPIAEQYPLAEHLTGLLMLALYRGGRGVDALDRYAAFRARLRDSLGNDPGEHLQRLHRQILRQDPHLLHADEADRRRGAAAPAMPTPAQLPAPVEGFTGRAAAIASLDRMLADPVGRAIRLATIVGMAGVGKTTLAVHWSHRVTRHFPDGQLYVNLRGFDARRRPVDPSEALRDLLRALGTAPQQIPDGVEAQASLYRSLLTGKRILVLLDNAHDEEQVRPLLPGTTGCLALVTSRNHMGGLVTTHSARPIALDALSDVESRRLLARRLGSARLSAEPDAAETIIGQCAGLPLALAIAAARAETVPDAKLRQLADELSDVQSTLTAFSGADAASDVRAVFSWSYRRLSVDAAKLFRLLGLHPGPDITTSATASLAGVARSRARELLGELVRVHLVAERVPDRFVTHDLLRAYATTMARDDARTERRDATRRMIDHYLHTAHRAATLLNPNCDPVESPPPRPGVTTQALADHDEALRWFAAEHRLLLSVLDHAAADGHDDRAIPLAARLLTFLYRQGHWHDFVATQRTVLAMAQRHGDRAAQARAHQRLGRISRYLDRPGDAENHLRQALALCIELGDVNGQARTEGSIAATLSSQGKHAEAVRHDRRSLRLAQTIDDKRLQGYAYNNLGWNLAHLGMSTHALRHCRRALAIARRFGHHDLESSSWDSLGFIHCQLDDLDQALTCYQRSVRLRRSLGARYEEAVSLSGVGDVHAALGDRETATATWQQALAIFEELGHPDGRSMRAKLRRSRNEARDEAGG